MLLSIDSVRRGARWQVLLQLHVFIAKTWFGDSSFRVSMWYVLVFLNIFLCVDPRQSHRAANGGGDTQACQFKAARGCSLRIFFCSWNFPCLASQACVRSLSFSAVIRSISLHRVRLCTIGLMADGSQTPVDLHARSAQALMKAVEFGGGGTEGLRASNVVVCFARVCYFVGPRSIIFVFACCWW